MSLEGGRIKWAQSESALAVLRVYKFVIRHRAARGAETTPLFSFTEASPMNTAISSVGAHSPKEPMVDLGAKTLGRKRRENAEQADHRAHADVLVRLNQLRKQVDAGEAEEAW